MIDSSQALHHPEYDEGQRLQWGAFFGQLPTGFKEIERYTGRTTLSKSISSAYGLPAIYLEVYGPKEYLPFFGCDYGISAELAPDKNFDVSRIMSTLKAFFGEPCATFGEEQYTLEGLGGSVPYNAKWKYQGVDVGISFFSNIRNEERGSTIANLYLKKTKILDLVEPFMDILEAKELAVSDPSKLLDIQFYNYEKGHARAYELTHNEDTPEDRANRFAIYPRLISTPDYIARSICEEGYAIWAYEDEGLYVSKRNSTVSLSPSDLLNKKARWTTLTPARGAGAEYLELLGLSIHGRYQGRTVYDMAWNIERRLNVEFFRQSYPDC